MKSAFVLRQGMETTPVGCREPRLIAVSVPEGITKLATTSIGGMLGSICRKKGGRKAYDPAAIKTSTLTYLGYCI